MSTIDALLDRSRAPGTFVERRTFSLARDKAIEKMREFALRDPRRSPLEIIQAANLGGARFIAVDATRAELVIAWLGGTAATPAQLGSLFDYLFVSQTDAAQRHLVQLAVGVNGLLQLGADLVRIESGDGTPQGSTRLEISGRDKITVGRTQDVIEGTYVYATLSVPWLDRLTGATVAAQSWGIDRLAQYSPAPILLNGQSPIGMCPHTRYGMLVADRGEQFAFGDLRGALGVGPDLRQVEIVIGGVRVARREIFGRRVGGILACDSLRKTADMSDIVEDDRWIEVLHALLPVARRLVGRDFEPEGLPPLPRRRKRASAAEPEPEPPTTAPPDPLPQLGARAALPLEAVLDPAQHPVDEPLFYVHTDEAAALDAACDLPVFPHRVLVLTPSQARGLAGRIPRLARLATPQDATFVRQAIARGSRTLVHRVAGGPLARLFPSAPGAPRAQLVVRLHLAGVEPRYDVAGSPPGAPLLIVLNGRTAGCGRLPLALPHVSAELRLPRGAPPELAFSEQGLATLTAATRAALATVTAEALSDPDRGPTIARSLLDALLRPAFERPDAGGAVALALHLPSGWEQARDLLLDHPLAPAEGGPVTARRLAQVQGTTSIIRLCDSTDLARLAGLCDRLGHGHLVEPEPPAPLAIVARTRESWHGVTDPLELGQAEELLIARASLAPTPPPEGWRALPDPAPCIGHLIRVDAEPTANGDAPTDPSPRRSAGLGALARVVEALRRGGLAAADDRRPGDMALLAALHLARLTGQSGAATLVDTAGRIRRVASLLGDPGFRAAPLGGVPTEDPGVVALPLDALHALDQLRVAMGIERPLPLASDDDPTAWASAPPAAWLVREPITGDGLTGWLALPRAFDPTLTVFVDRPTQVIALSEMSIGIPCCGLLTLSTTPGLNPQHRRLIALGAQRLVAQLLPLLRDRSDPVATASATSYAGRWIAGHLTTRPHAPLDGLMRELAEHVRLPEPNASWTLLRWAEASASSRPALPPAWTEGHRAPATDPATSTDEEADQTLARPVADELTLRLHRPTALRVERTGGGSARVTASAAGPRVLRVLIPHDHARWNRGLRGDRGDRLRAQLWLVGLLARDLEPEGHRIDQGAMAIGLIASIR